MAEPWFVREVVQRGMVCTELSPSEPFVLCFRFLIELK